MGVLEDKMRVVLNDLVRSQHVIFSAIAELRAQGFTTEASNLETALTTLKTNTDAAIAAVG